MKAKLKTYHKKIIYAFAHRHDQAFSWVDYVYTILFALPIGVAIGLMFGVMNKRYVLSISVGIIHGTTIGIILTFANQLSVYLSQIIYWKPISNSVVFLVMVANSLAGVYLVNFFAELILEVQGNSPSAVLVMTIFYTVLGYLIFSKMRQRNQLDSKITEQEVKLLELKQLKTQAELDALHAKVNPHFLYNSLNSIASLIHANPNQAEQMTLLLSKFFRYNTNRQNDHLTALGEELEMIETYLEIEKVRFGKRLQYHLHLPENAKNYLIPRFLLQPLVENAIKHGISKLPDKGHLYISVIPENELLKIVIRDNGPAFSDSLQMGYGLQSTQDKLQLLFPENAHFHFENAPKKQIIITLKKMLAHEYTQPLPQIVQNPHYRR